MSRLVLYREKILSRETNSPSVGIKRRIRTIRHLVVVLTRDSSSFSSILHMGYADQFVQLTLMHMLADGALDL